MVQNADRGGGGAKNPENFADILCTCPLSDSAIPSEDWLGGFQGVRARGGTGQQVDGQSSEDVVRSDLIQVYQGKSGTEGGTTLRSFRFVMPLEPCSQMLYNPPIVN